MSHAPVGQLRPSGATHDPADVALTHSVLLGDLGLREATPVLATDCLEELRGELQLGVISTAGVARHQSLTPRIAQVFRLITDEQVSRVHTEWSIAMVADVHPRGDESVLEFPREPMRINVPQCCSTPTDGAVSAVRVPRPQPAVAETHAVHRRSHPLRHLRPKTFRDRDRCSRHVRSLSLVEG